MPEFTVQAAAKKKDIPDSGRGAKQVLALTLARADGDPVIAEWFTAANTPIPQPGAKLDGDLTQDPQWGWKFKKAGSGGGGFGGGKRDPATDRRITRQHSQDMALRTLELADRYGVNLPEFDSVNALVDVVKKIADAYDRDAYAVGEGRAIS